MKLIFDFVNVCKQQVQIVLIIDKYLALDQEDRQKMADVYQREECFNKIGALHPSVRKKGLRILNPRSRCPLLWI